MKVSTKSSGVSLHFEKHKANDTAVNGLQRHNERVPGQKHSNKNINDERTADNIFLKRSDGKYKESVSKVIENNRENGLKGVRKDAVRMVEATVQLSGGILERSEDEQEQVLRDSYEWLKNTFGEENVISAVIHKDETNMHLHFDFVPIRDGKLNAKKIISKGELHKYQSDFLAHLQDEHPAALFERGGGELNGLSQEVFEKVQAERDALKQELEESYQVIEQEFKEKEKALDERAKLQDKRDKSLDEREAVISVKDQQADKKLEEASKTSQEANMRLLDAKEREQTNEAREKSLDEREDELNQQESKLKELKNEIDTLMSSASANFKILLERAKESKVVKRMLNVIDKNFEEDDMLGKAIGTNMAKEKTDMMDNGLKPMPSVGKEFEDSVNALTEHKKKQLNELGL